MKLGDDKVEVLVDGKPLPGSGSSTELMTKSPPGFRRLTPEEQLVWEKQGLMGAVFASRINEHGANLVAARLQVELAELKLKQAHAEHKKHVKEVENFNKSLGILKDDDVATSPDGTVFIRVPEKTEKA